MDDDDTKLPQGADLDHDDNEVEVSQADQRVVEQHFEEFKKQAAKHTALSDDATLRRFLLGGFDADPSAPLEKALVMHKEALLWRQQFAVERIKIDTVHDEMHTGKLIFPEAYDKAGRPILVLRPRFVVRSLVDPLAFMKSVVYTVEKAITKMRPQGPPEFCVIIDFSGASLSNVDTRLPRVALSTLQNNYPRRVGKAIILNAPWFFKYVWVVVSRWMSSDFRGRVSITNNAGLREWVDDDNILEDMGGKKKHDFRDWIRAQFDAEGIDVDRAIVPPKSEQEQGRTADDAKADDSVDNLVVQALEDEVVEKPVKAGWLTKLGGIIRNWKRRYFVLSNGLVRYYKEEADVKPQGTIILERSRVADKNEHGKAHSFQIVTPLRTYEVFADNDQDKQDWMKVVAEQCQLATYGPQNAAAPAAAAST